MKAGRKMVSVLMLTSLSFWVQAEILTVNQVKTLLEDGEIGRAAAIAYIQGVTDGILAMDSLAHKETGKPYEFCKLHEAYASGTPEKHPAYQTKRLVSAWEKNGYPMETLAVDMMLGFLTRQYGCR
jgi:hypothetical protein